MKTQLILARTSSGCAALIVNQVVVAQAETTAEIDKLVTTAARQMSIALRVPLVECQVEPPDELDGVWEWADLLELLPPVQEQIAKHIMPIYCWSEDGVHPCTVDGPGDAWDELCFDTQPPVAGTPYYVLAPIHTVDTLSTDELVEQMTMSILRKPHDQAPGVNWQCDRQWRVNDVRAAVRRALEATRIILPPAGVTEPATAS